MSIYLLKRAWKNRKVKWNVFRKSSSYFTFSQDDCRKSIAWNFPRLEIVVFNNSFVWHFSCCDYLVSRADPRNVATSKISLLRQEWTFFSFSVTTVAKRSFFKMTGFLDLFFWTVKSLFRGISRKSSSCLLKKISKHTSLLYLCIFEKVVEKARDKSDTGSILWNCGIADHSLLKMNINMDDLLEISRRFWLQH